MESAHATTARVVSNDTQVDNEQRILIEAIKHDIGAVEDVTILAGFAEKLGLALGAGQVDAIVAGDEEVPLTEQEQVDAIGVEVADGVKEVLKDQGIFGAGPTTAITSSELPRRLTKSPATGPETVVLPSRRWPGSMPPGDCGSVCSDRRAPR